MLMIVDKAVTPADVLRFLEIRRQELGMPMSSLARRAELGLRTVQRTLSGESKEANLGTVLKLAGILGVSFEPRKDRGLLRRTAAQKAKQLAAMVQGTSALEDQAVGRDVIRTIEQQLMATLLAGSRSRLWND